MVPTDAALFVLLTLAAAAGFFAGRWRRPVPAEQLSPAELSLPLTNPPIDFAVDSILSDVRVDDQSVGVFLALGTLVRRRGEIDKAIELHRALQARPGLSARNRERVQLELARDYLHGGLLGTAESLLEPLVRGTGPVAGEAGSDLMEVYEQERDWPRAERLARIVAAAGDPGTPRRLGHYLCEQAESALAAGQGREARTFVHEALLCDPACVRGWLLLGGIELADGQPDAAIAALERVGQCDPRYISEALPLLRRACLQLQQPQRLDAFLESCAERVPEARITEALVERRLARGDVDGVRSAWLRDLERHRDVRALSGWVATQAGEARAHWVPELVATLGALLATDPAYRCEACGFSAAELHWHCPSCRAWGSALPLGGGADASTPRVVVP